MENYLDYCQAGTPFYEHPGHDREGSFDAVGRALPAGWERRIDSTWVFLEPPGVKLPEQGWKLHVSATPEDTEAVIDLVWDCCVARGLAFKFLPTARMHLAMNAKYAPRRSSGKLVTVYTCSEPELEAALLDLSATLEPYRGPYILSDLRWQDGPVYLRYGAFHKLSCTAEDGTDVPAIRRPDGVLVPDPRGPVFRIPEWVPVPSFVAQELDRSAQVGATDQMPYTVERALHFSNGGGIYLARDPETGERVVLREARPLAGLDGAGQDAVLRLETEARALRDLAGISAVPALHRTFSVWEHRYLAEEYIQGETLWQMMARQNPYLTSVTDPAQVARYTAIVLDVLSQIEIALSEIHARGYVFADLHPRNVMIRQDGRVALVDYEISYRPPLDPPPSLGCPGYVAAHADSGADRDIYALNSLRAAVFLPLTTLLDLDAGKIDDLVTAIAELFPVPSTVIDQIRTGLTRPHTSPDRSRQVAALFDPPDAGLDPWLRRLESSMVTAIEASATPHRADRLHPGDPAGLSDGGYNLAHGAAGAIHALAASGREPAAEHVDWLVRAATTSVPVRAGLLSGVHGAAVVLHRCGRVQEALDLLRSADEAVTATSTPHLHGGLAGVGLALRHLARATNQTAVHDRREAVVKRLVEIQRAATGPASAAHRRTGLMFGWTGVALFDLVEFEDSGDPRFLDLAKESLDRDLAHCHVTDTGEVLVDDGRRLLPYLDNGSVGMASVAAAYLRHRDDDRLATLLPGMLRAATIPVTIQPSLFGGRAGLMNALANHATDPGEVRDALVTQVKALVWHAVPYAEGVAFPGHALLRLSMDLATGTAGVLLALTQARAALAGAPVDRSAQLIPGVL
nr:class III lanthionine synthetase LanKC [Actinoplanes sp. NBRC 103695]